MLKPEHVQNKAGPGAGGDAAPPRPAVCPRCGGLDAVALPGPTPHVVAVRCPACGPFAWDVVACAVVPEPER
jgi:hypothetical protein